MRLPNICRTSVKTRVNYLSLISHMARIDNKLDKNEVELLEKMIGNFGLNEKHKERIIKTQDYNDAQIEAIFNEIKSKKLHYSFFLDLIAMAVVDGVIMDEEKIMLGQIVKLIGIPRDDFHNIINFAHSTLGMDVNILIDPMYSYVINSFFDWVHQKNVKIFSQTTLAIDDKIDAYLKNKL
ncbi:MAG: TerB family tellurite resistance protein [Deltaproteobacteria bacterium]|nr:TerB family tellurite resistance protein [Deltaproteobacteria bacterium]